MCIYAYIYNMYTQICTYTHKVIWQMASCYLKNWNIYTLIILLTKEI